MHITLYKIFALVTLKRLCQAISLHTELFHFNI